MSHSHFITNICYSAGGLASSQLLKADSSLTLLIASKIQRAEILAEDTLFFEQLKQGEKASNLHLLSLPPLTDAETGELAFENLCDLLNVLTSLRQSDPGERFVLACTPESLRQAVPAPEKISSHELVLRIGESVSLKKLAEQLSNEFDYYNEALCEAPGQFSVRGGLIDVYPLNANAPVRIDFFGDEIESLREFDPTSQRSLKKLNKLVITGGSSGGILDKNSSRTGNLFKYFPQNTQLIFSEPELLNEAVPVDLINAAQEKNWKISGFSAFDEIPTWLLNAKEDSSAQNNLQTWETQDLEELSYGDFDATSLGVERIAEIEELRKRILLTLNEFAQKKERILIVCENLGTKERLIEILKKERNSKELGKKFNPEIQVGKLSAGFRCCSPHGNIVIATEREIFGRQRRRIAQVRSRRLPNKSHVEQLLDFSELVNGDYLVHLQHGICIFRGIKTLEQNGKKEDFFTLEFENKITLYVPLRETHLISRYVGLRKTVPKLAKLNGNTWEKTRSAAERASIDFAAELLNLQAKRTTKPGIAMKIDSELPWLQEFEKTFPFTETPDQARAIAETKYDQEKSTPMDRLLCGDVGFGKTEIAIRAAFKAVLSGYQVAILAPTTVLTQQHFNTFQERFAHYPVAIEMLSRFRSPKERKKILSQLERGEIDIIVGTHALLSAKIHYKKLGLLVIDEEHRFGVKQKEAIKRFRENIDVLAMSATPIPRTLYMALMGARDLSVIETAPRERLPIKTIVKTYDAKLVKEAILHETSRGGQVFYLHNRVDTIYEVASLLRNLLPELKIAVGHGQMSADDLEQIMTDFVAGKFDVLVCTTIIETGLDIPNCNTIIIEGADRFGLGQLYQLRGRVGRFNRQAYAYLLLHKHRVVLDIAQRRLSAMRQFNRLGAGFRIAMRDLELRGAGNILGLKQSGHIAGVGFELYCQLLKQSISKLKGEPIKQIFRAEIRLDFVNYSELPQSDAKDNRSNYEILRDAKNEKFKSETILATLSPKYIPDIRVRIEAFRKLAIASTPEEVQEIELSMEDRFGKLPAEAKTFCALAELRCLAEIHGIVKLETNAGQIKAQKRNGDYVLIGNNFPRLSQIKPLKRLKELKDWLKRI